MFKSVLLHTILESCLLNIRHHQPPTTTNTQTKQKPKRHDGVAARVAAPRRVGGALLVVQGLPLPPRCGVLIRALPSLAPHRVRRFVVPPTLFTHTHTHTTHIFSPPTAYPVGFVASKVKFDRRFDMRIDAGDTGPRFTVCDEDDV